MKTKDLSKRFFLWGLSGLVVCALGILLMLPASALASKGGNEGKGSNYSGEQGGHGYGTMSAQRTMEKVQTKEMLKNKVQVQEQVQDQDSDQDQDQDRDRDRDRDHLGDQGQDQDRDRDRDH